MPILIDTNILLRVAEPSSAEHRECVDALQLLAKSIRGPVLCAQTMIEFWVVATRPVAVNGLGMDSVEASATLDYFERLMRCLPEPADMAARWRDVADQYGVIGKPAHDARLVALMLASGINEIISLNVGDFKRYGSIRCFTPQDILSLP